MKCTRSWEVRAIDEGRLAQADVTAFERHAARCASCRDESARLAELRTLTAQLPAASPSELDVRRLRARVLRDAMASSSVRPGRAVLPALGAAAALAAAALFARNHAGEGASRAREPFAGSVIRSEAARWTQTREAGVERVVLTDGYLALHVRKQGPEERFTVALPDGEVEVRGTTFDVAVHDAKTERVHVDEGVVVVRVHGESVVAAGESWPSAPAAEPASRPAAVEVPAVPEEPSAKGASAPLPPRPPKRPGSAPRPADPRPAPPGSTDSEDEEMAAYEHAVDAYRLGRFSQAAELLRAFTEKYPSSSMLDDAWFIEASSLASAGSTEAAGRLAQGHERRFPSSFHRKDAAILVARMHRDHSDCAAARAAVGAWPRDATIEAALGSCASGD
jgi:TolA-binding protein